jgi:UDP-N-acetylmuramyl-tripeptide synthetase
MEVSSHGLHRGRVNGCAFDVGVFTNLTQDHLDYHGDIEEYYLAKRILFDKILPSSGKPAKAVVNADDSYGRRLFDEIAFPNKIRFGRSQGNEVHPELIEFDRHGIRGRVHTPQGTVRVRSELAGEFNISNISAAVAVGVSMGLSVDAIERGIEALTNVPGRLERVESHVGAIFVDYAHTPDAVKNVLAALQGMGDARIITIIGCGGDRDRAKRPLMGMEAARGSHFVILTSDNPRSEDALTILRAMEEGASEASTLSDEIKAHGYTVIPDRREAIAWAVQRLSENDVLLVAGKGHETYQEIKGVKYPFDDREVIREETAEAKAGRMGSERLR